MLLFVFDGALFTFSVTTEQFAELFQFRRFAARFLLRLPLIPARSVGRSQGQARFAFIHPPFILQFDDLPASSSYTRY